MLCPNCLANELTVEGETIYCDLCGHYIFKEDIMYQELVGLSGGHDQTYWEVLAVGEPFSSTYWPAVIDGKEKSFSDFPDLDSFLAAKVERRRVTVRLTIAGNPIAAENEIARLTGKRCLATTPNTLDIYVIEDSEEE